VGLGAAPPIPKLNQNEAATNTIERGELVLDLRARCARFADRTIPLTPREFDLLECLARHPGWVFSKERLLELVWGYEFGDPRTVCVHLGNLRRKLGQAAGAVQYIRTVKGVGYKLEVPATQAHGLSSWTVPSQPMVGREEELSHLLATWEVVKRKGQGRAVLVAGEAGIGKTRLIQEFAVRLQKTGSGVLWGRSCRTEGAPAYLPWAEMVEPFLRAGRSREVPEINQLRARLVPLLSDLAAEGATFPPVEDSAAARYRLYDAVTALLRLACRTAGPLLLVLDDLHDADRHSLALLAHVARNLAPMPILLTACYRRERRQTDDALGHALATLTKEVLTLQLDLKGLDEGGVAALLEVLGESPFQAESVTHVTDETQGNPFFVMEQVRLLLVKRRLPPDMQSPPELTDGVRATVEGSLARLHPRARRLLEIASVAGREFSFAVLERVSGESPADLLESLEEATSAHIIQPIPRKHRCFRFIYGHLRRDLYCGLGLAERALLHGRIGDAIEGLASAGADDRVDELADHYLEAAPLGWRDKALDYRLRATRGAMDCQGWENARQHLEQALAIVGLVEDETIPRHPRCEAGSALELYHPRSFRQDPLYVGRSGRAERPAEDTA
jgi:eukaryotic-like serine/threonine-protein kinase